MLLASVGIVKMPDVFTRLQTTSKAATLGVMCTFLALALYSGDLGIAARSFAIILFVFLTAPIAAHMLARAAYVVGVPLWSGTRVDELRSRYDLSTHTLRSSAPTTAVEGESPSE